MNARVQSALGLPAPLRPAPDMAPVWSDVDLDFDTAADRFIARHRADGAMRDMPVMDLRMWAIAPVNDRFTLKPLAGHEPPRQLRATAFSNLCTRLGAPAEFIRDKLPAPLQLATLNYLMAQGEKPGTVMLRLRGDEIGAIGSERYAPLDAVELVDTLRTALVRHGLLDSVRRWPPAVARVPPLLRLPPVAGTPPVATSAAWYAVLTVTVAGVTMRKWVPLETDNKAVARRKLARLVADHSTTSSLDALGQAAKAPETYAELAERVRASRTA